MSPDPAAESTLSRRDRQRAAVAAVVDKEMSDTRFDVIRTRRARRLLVIAYTAVTVGSAVGWLVAGAFGLLALPLWAVLFYLLRRSIRNVADLPDEHLDERQIAARDRTYVHAYRGFATLALCMLFGLAIAADRTTLTYDHLSGAMWLSIGVSIGLPAAIMAWTTDDS